MKADNIITLVTPVVALLISLGLFIWNFIWNRNSKIQSFFTKRLFEFANLVQEGVEHDLRIVKTVLLSGGVSEEKTSELVWAHLNDQIGHLERVEIYFRTQLLSSNAIVKVNTGDEESDFLKIETFKFFANSVKRKKQQEKNSKITVILNEIEKEVSEKVIQLNNFAAETIKKMNEETDEAKRLCGIVLDTFKSVIKKISEIIIQTKKQ